MRSALLPGAIAIRGVFLMFLKDVGRLAAIVSVAAAVSACGSAPTWEKAGATMDERDNRISKCRYEIGLNKIDDDERDDLLSDCMRADGYRLRES